MRKSWITGCELGDVSPTISRFPTCLSMTGGCYISRVDYKFYVAVVEAVLPAINHRCPSSRERCIGCAVPMARLAYIFPYGINKNVDIYIYIHICWVKTNVDICWVFQHSVSYYFLNLNCFSCFLSSPLGRF